MLQFSDTANRLGIIQIVEDDTGLGKDIISGDTDLLKQFTARANTAVAELHNIILKADGRMQYDDPNHTNARISEADLVSGQKKYEVFEALPADAQDWLEVESVEILDENDNGVKLKPMDLQDIGIAESEFQDTDGTPRFFDFDGAELKLYPSPNYAKTDGLIIVFKRASSYFVYTDTTKVLGFNSDFHPLVPKKMTLGWGIKMGLSYVRDLRADILVGEKELAKAYSRRNKYEKLRITRLKRRYK